MDGTEKKHEVHPRSVMGRTLSSTSTSLLKRLSTRPTGVQSKKPMLGARSTPASSPACSARAAVSVPRYSASDDTDTDTTGTPLALYLSALLILSYCLRGCGFGDPGFDSRGRAELS